MDRQVGDQDDANLDPVSVDISGGCAEDDTRRVLPLFPPKQEQAGLRGTNCSAARVKLTSRKKVP